MLKIKIDSQLYTIVIPLAIVIASCSLLILVNFFTIKFYLRPVRMLMVNLITLKLKRMQQDTLLLMFTKDLQDWIAFKEK
jgi:hypothetical protein